MIFTQSRSFADVSLISHGLPRRIGASATERLVFSNARKIAQQTAQHLISGHLTLIAWWTLKHAGVFDAILKMEAEHSDGLDPLVHATRTTMAPDVLWALLDYAVSAGLVAVKDEKVYLTPEGKALYEHEDGLLELVRAYEPVVEMVEHLLARLKTVGAPGGGGNGGGNGGTVMMRRSEALLDSQGRRYAGEVYPAIQRLVHDHKLTHLLDLSGGTPDLLIYLARKMKHVVGVCIGNDGPLIRRANAAITNANLEKRLIAVTANPVEVLTDTRRVFDRIGISRQLWDDVDCIVIANAMSDWTNRNPESLPKALGAIPKNFPKASLLLAEPTLTSRLEKTYYAPEIALLHRLAKTTPDPPETWRSRLHAAHLKIKSETPLITDSITLFLTGR